MILLNVSSLSILGLFEFLRRLWRHSHFCRKAAFEAMLSYHTHSRTVPLIFPILILLSESFPGTLQLPNPAWPLLRRPFQWSEGCRTLVYSSESGALTRVILFLHVFLGILRRLLQVCVNRLPSPLLQVLPL